MNLATADAIVRATLYEGYVLYPYRPSSLKNRQRWSFGGLSPKGEGDRSVMQMECLIVGDDASVELGVRFLHLGDRKGWQEATERRIALEPTRLSALLSAAITKTFSFQPEAQLAHGADEPLLSPSPSASAPLHQVAVHGRVELSAITGANATRLRIRVHNDSPAGALALLASTHILVGVRDGALLSLTDPPARYAAEAAACRNEGCWPVLIGEEGASDLLLASPIILPDYPKIAPESPGDLFDATEIDEILTLRILTMTDDEKREACAAEPRIAALFARVAALGPEELMGLHGALRKERATPIRVGDRVRLVPKDRADAFDLLLAGKTATIVSLEEDFEGCRYYTVTIDDDPGKDLGADGRPGHRFFFKSHEVERL